MSIQKGTTFSLKDLLFNRERVEYLAGEIKKVYPSFHEKGFIQKTVQGFKGKELKERMFYITKMLEEFLPKEYKKAVDIMLKSLPQEVPESENFIFSGYTDFVAKHGCKKQYLAYSLQALEEMTQYFSAEFAIRTFLNAFPDETLNYLYRLAKSTNYKKRRLVSEGTRPKLPWAPKISLEYTQAVPFLDVLHADSQRYVTRSVANHLNDISKINDNFAIKLAKKWQLKEKQNQKEMDYIIRHGLRTLLKRGHSEALSLLGYSQNAKVEIKNVFVQKKQIRIGEYLEYKFDIFAKNKEKILLDYIVTYPGLGEKTSQKVFQIKRTQINKEEVLTVKKRHRFAPMTTKKLYAGKYGVQIRINGCVQAKFEFSLKI